MQICKVVGTVIATRKHEQLTGCRFLIVAPLNSKTTFVAADHIGAGVDETVLVVNGCTARLACGHDQIPVDAAVVGIVDEGCSI